MFFIASSGVSRVGTEFLHSCFGANQLRAELEGNNNRHSTAVRYNLRQGLRVNDFLCF